MVLEGGDPYDLDFVDGSFSADGFPFSGFARGGPDDGGLLDANFAGDLVDENFDGGLVDLNFDDDDWADVDFGGGGFTDDGLNGGRLLSNTTVGRDFWSCGRTPGTGRGVYG